MVISNAFLLSFLLLLFQVTAQQDLAGVQNPSEGLAHHLSEGAEVHGDQQQYLKEEELVVPDLFQVVFLTDVMFNGQQGHFTINVTKSFAENGAIQFYKLILDGFYDSSCFFRVVPDFVVQWGIAASPELTRRWSIPIKDDLVEVSNEAWTVAFATAGPDTRTTQVFVNMGDNTFLDTQGFAPFGEVVAGMEVLKAIYNPSPGKPSGVDQFQYEKMGNAWLKPKIPKINCITQAYISDQRMLQ